MTNLEIVERALKNIADPDWEFKESVILLLASRLASEQPSNKPAESDSTGNEAQPLQGKWTGEL